jgi:Txe/YoeB family toxin of Txe-Axe toxin-antitoxin module
MDSPKTVLCGLASFLNSGGEALRAFFLARSAKQKGYRLKKQFRALMNDTMTNIWDGEWEDSTTGRRMKGFWSRSLDHARRQNRGLETAFNSGRRTRRWMSARCSNNKPEITRVKMPLSQE